MSYKKSLKQPNWILGGVFWIVASVGCASGTNCNPYPYYNPYAPVPYPYNAAGQPIMPSPAAAGAPMAPGAVGAVPYGYPAAPPAGNAMPGGAPLLGR